MRKIGLSVAVLLHWACAQEVVNSRGSTSASGGNSANSISQLGTGGETTGGSTTGGSTTGGDTTGGSTTGGTTTGGATTGGSTTGGTTTGGTDVPKAEPLGTITQTKNELPEFSPKSTYGLYSEVSGVKSFMLSVSQINLSKNSLRKIKEYKCRACNETTPEVAKCACDPSKPECKVAARSLSLAFRGGYPTKEKFELAGDFAADAQVGLSVIYSDGSAVKMKAAGSVTFAKLPTKVGDPVDAKIAFKFNDATPAVSYEADVKTEVISFPTNPTPACESIEWADPVYE